MKKTSLFLFFFLTFTGALSWGQHYLPGESLFPEPGDFIPRRVRLYLEREEKKQRDAIRETQEKKDPFFYPGEEYSHMRRFFTHLHQLESGERETLRIMHFGDSLMWGENFSSKIRRRFQKDFGNGGRGLVPIVEIPSTELKDHENLTKPWLFSHTVLKHRFNQNGQFVLLPPLNPQLGFTGESAMPLYAGSTVEFRNAPGMAPWHQVRLFYHTLHSSPVTVTLRSGETTYTSTDNERQGISVFTTPDVSHVSLSVAADEPVYIEAASLEGKTGIIYDSVIRMGIHMAWIDLAVSDALIDRGLKELNPSLIIFHFGINEVASIDSLNDYTMELYHEQMREWITRVQHILPETDILLIGPMERLRRVGTELVPFEEVDALRAIQKDEAHELGYSFFDTWQYLGGEGHMEELVNRRWATDDYTHLTVLGGDRLGDAFYDTLLSHYHNFRGEKNDSQALEALELKTSQAMAIQFNSLSYAWFFLSVIFLILLFFRFPRLRILVLVAASWYFYATWKVWPLLLLLFSTVLDYFLAFAISASRKKGRRGTFYLLLSLMGNLGLLFTFKYFDFIAGLASQAAAATGYAFEPFLLNTLLPVGISFYTFQTLSYTIDVWRGEMQPERNFLRFALFVSFFPQLVAGPIVRAKDFIPSLRNDNRHFTVTTDHIFTGLFLIGGGLLKKMGADWLATSIIDRVYQNPSMFSSVEVLTAVFAYGLQIYGDFSGYTDIALGSARIMGYNLTENFNRPYQSRTVSEFWRRWHISLGSWFRDYLYISLGGNQRHVYLNLFITMFLCGLWHGAGVNFVLWGVYHGLFLMIERKAGVSRLLPKGVSGFLLQVYTFMVVLFGWIIFRAGSWETFTGVIQSMKKLTISSANISPLLITVIAGAYLFHFTPVRWRESMKTFWLRTPAFFQAAAATVLLFLLYQIRVSGIQPFIYFQF